MVFVFAILVAAFLVGACVGSVVFAQVQCQPIGTITVIASSLNIRQTPGAGGSLSGSLKEGDVMGIVLRDPATGWYKICEGGGWVSGNEKYVRFVANAPTQTPAITPTRITPVPTLTELIVFVKVFIKYGDNQSVDSGLFPWRANQPVSCQLVRVDNHPQPTVTALP